MLGLGLSLIGIRLFDAATQDVGKPYWIQFTMDRSVFLFLAAVCLGTGVIFGLAPALHVSKTDVNEILKEGGRSGSAGTRVRRWSGALVIAELALTLTLLAGAGFMVRNFLTHYRLDIGIDSSQLLTMNSVCPTANTRRSSSGSPSISSCRSGCRRARASGPSASRATRRCRAATPGN